jgi:hypothetical protein
VRRRALLQREDGVRAAGVRRVLAEAAAVSTPGRYHAVRGCLQKPQCAPCRIGIRGVAPAAPSTGRSSGMRASLFAA